MFFTFETRCHYSDRLVCSILDCKAFNNWFFLSDDFWTTNYIGIIIIIIYLFGFSSKRAVVCSFTKIVMCCHCLHSCYVPKLMTRTHRSTKNNKKSICDLRLIFASKTFQPYGFFFWKLVILYSSVQGLKDVVEYRGKLCTLDFHEFCKVNWIECIKFFCWIVLNFCSFVILIVVGRCPWIIRTIWWTVSNTQYRNAW